MSGALATPKGRARAAAGNAVARPVSAVARAADPRLARYEALVDAGERRALDRQHAKGKRTARERIGLLVDPGTFQETNRLMGADAEAGAPGCAVVTGLGRVSGRTVAVYAQDFSVRGGTLGTAEGHKIVRLIEQAVRIGVPVVAIVDSGGARIQEGVAALAQYGRIFHATCHASGRVPQISLVLGPCAGGAVYCPALTDLIVMTRDNSNMFVTGPEVVREATGEDIGRDDLGGGLVHGSVSGVAHYLADDEEDAIDYVRTVLGYLPSCADEEPPVYEYRAVSSEKGPDEALAAIMPERDREPYDMRDVIGRIVDYGEFVQVHGLYAPSALVGFACIQGRPVGVVANQPAVASGVLDVDSSEKIARFVRLCDAFNLPVITLVDTPGYRPGSDQEHAGIIRRGATMIYAYAQARVPLVTVVLRKAFGGAYIVMGSRSLGADAVFTWPTARIAVLGARAAVGIIHHRDLAAARERGEDVEALRSRLALDYDGRVLNADLALRTGQIDAMIDPARTRETIVTALASLSGKRRGEPPRHHGNPPF
ncbi:acyl-CoA carboxylase subunit beta [uncultured Bifidobacterium sp.]|uniref:acyl-CoA carboxylase subunit beta n=1 Tax=uncultured Bifidobacterium sp. TaxID=165187 RepID=UPI0028DBB3D8|nr:acyl-CoA carboxylase subunit beta [uncultured Bifidobacterium sp.]